MMARYGFVALFLVILTLEFTVNVQLGSPSIVSADVVATETPRPKTPPTPTFTPTLTPTPILIETTRFFSSEWTSGPGPIVSSSAFTWDAFCLNTLHCWIATSGTSEGLYSTADGGMTWQPTGPTIGRAFSVFMAGPSNGFFSAGGDGVYRTTDGSTWELVFVGGVPLHDVFFVDNRVGFAGGYSNSKSVFFKTTNGGQSWQPWYGAFPFPLSIYRIVMLDEDVGWFADHRAVKFTNDGWRSSYISLQGRDTYLNRVDFLDYWNGWVVGGYPGLDDSRGFSGVGLVFRTTDAGRTWNKLTLPRPYGVIDNVKFMNAWTGWAVSRVPAGKVILRTDDGGDTWKAEGELPPDTRVEFVRFPSERRIWIVVVQTTGSNKYDTRLYKLEPRPPVLEEIGGSYRMLLCREPDAGGLEFWYSTGLSQQAIKTAMRQSNEGVRVYTIDDLYWHIFVRHGIPADCAGVHSWSDSGLSIKEVSAALENSPEGQRVKYVRIAYIDLLGRDPLGRDNDSLRAWVDTSLSIDQIRAAIMQSHEYKLKHPAG